MRAFIAVQGLSRVVALIGVIGAVADSESSFLYGSIAVGSAIVAMLSYLMLPAQVRNPLP